MYSVLELERDKDYMSTDGPEARAFRMALGVLQDRNNRIRGEWNIRVLCLPPIFKHLIASHVIHHLIRTFCLGEGIGHIGVPDVHTQQCRKHDLKADINLVWRRCISRAMDHGFTTASGSITESSYFLAVILVGLDGIHPYPEEDGCVNRRRVRRSKH
jgi:hypothetical protein